MLTTATRPRGNPAGRGLYRPAGGPAVEPRPPARLAAAVWRDCPTCWAQGRIYEGPRLRCWSPCPGCFGIGQVPT